jgi:hypothetical protein
MLFLGNFWQFLTKFFGISSKHGQKKTKLCHGFQKIVSEAPKKRQTLP